MQVRERLMLSVVFAIMPGCISAGRASYEALSWTFQAAEREQRDARLDAERALGSETLGREALVRAVLAQNPSIEAARQAWRAALARYRQAGAYDDPMLMASFAPLSLASARARFGYDVQISQRIPLGGKLDAQAALAAAEAQAVASEYSDARLKLAVIASQVYDDYVVAVRSLEIQKQHVSLLQALKQNAITAYESGHAAAQDMLQAEAELARLEYQNTVYETQRDIAMAQINTLLHRQPDAALPAPKPFLRDEAEPRVLTALMQEVKTRPDLVSARARVQVARARAVAAESNLYPDLTLSTSYNTMWDMPEHRWMAGIALNLPLQRGRRHGAIEEAAAMRAASESEMQSLMDSARGEVAIVLRQLRESRSAVQLYEQRLVPVARERIEAARAGFIASQTNFMTVIEAEHGLRTAELELEVARAELSKRRAALDRVLGRMPGPASMEVHP